MVTGFFYGNNVRCSTNYIDENDGSDIKSGN